MQRTIHLAWAIALLSLPAFTTAGLAAEPSESDASTEAAASGEPVPGEGIAGDWLGTLAAGPVELRLALHVEAAADGGWSVVFDSIDQGTKVPVEELTFEGGEVRLSLPVIQGLYVGTMNEDGSAIEGEWSQAGTVLPLVFERQAAPFELARPQEPRPPFPYVSRDVAFENEAAGLTLAGSYVVPAGEGPFPAVLFVSGSGPQDRDEQIMGHRPFLVIADHLARHGVASLRFDDRGFGASEGDHMGSTIADFATDVEAGLAFLRSQPEVDGGAVGILGHSEGGLTGPMVAAERDDVAFLVVLAPPAVPLIELLARQTADILRLSGLDEDLVARAVRQQVSDLELVRDESLTDEELRDELRARAASLREAFSEEELAILGVVESTMEQSLAVSSSPWFRSLTRVDPAAYWRHVDVPVLALFGDLDIQVAAEENAAALERALAAGSNDAAEIRILPGLNHLLQHAETGSVEEYGALAETIAPEVLETLASWIRDNS